MTERDVDIDDDLLKSAPPLDEIRKSFEAAASVPLNDADRDDAWR